ncbi:MAG: IclR family transcriptional regulator [Deltaproteobacteria bacterium]|nr:IclR family transcriptional regulator [Deltaproteobacteria bacterium]
MGLCPEKWDKMILTIRSGIISKAIRLIRLIADNAAMDWPVREISSKIGIPRSTVHRICHALTNEGILELDPKTKRYHWGPELVYIAQAVYQGNEVRRLAMPVLRKIVTECNETAHLSIYERSKKKLIFTDELPCSQLIRFNTPIGMSLPLHPGASGKSIMAYLPEKEIKKIINSGLEAVTSRTVTNPKRVREDLKEVRLNGYAKTEGERTPEAVGIACPIFDSKAQVIASLVVTIPSYRFNPEIEHSIVQLVRDGSEHISRLLGLPLDIPYPPPYEDYCNRRNAKKRKIRTKV